MVKQVKTRNDSDRISSLTDPILCHILSFLPIGDAVRSSILSPRWRHLFASMSTLNLTGQDLLNLPHSYVVDRLLFSPRQVSLECFRVWDLSSSDYDYLRVYGWICAVLCHGVKEIVFYGAYSEKSFMLPTPLFTCHSLVKLDLDIYSSEIKVPSYVHLPILKTLLLEDLKFPDDGALHRLISNCIVLEELVLNLCETSSTSKLIIHNLSLKSLVLDFCNCRGIFNCGVDLNAPNLVYFKYWGMIAKGYALSNMKVLERADIKIYLTNWSGEYNENREPGATHLLQAISDVQSLNLCIDYAELFQRPLEQMFKFQRLVELKFRNPKREWQGTWLVDFLHCVPNLKKLTMFLDMLYLKKEEEESRPPPTKLPSCLLFHLKEITISRYFHRTQMFEMASYFLNHARVLEKLVIRRADLDDERELSTIKKLSELPRISTTCQILLAI